MKIKILVGTLMALMIFTLEATAQKAWESEGVNPELWMRLPFEDERAYIFTHWERMHPHAVLPGAESPRVYERNTHALEEGYDSMIKERRQQLR